MLFPLGFHLRRDKRYFLLSSTSYIERHSYLEPESAAWLLSTRAKRA